MCELQVSVYQFNSTHTLRVGNGGKNIETHIFWLARLFVCLFNWSLRAETHLGLDGTRLQQNTQARLKKPITCMLAN